jgi:2-polyprenyl-3-methyl-5-hydroxy-6-metoxy-1,4-benzoquinol methylase
MGNLFENEKEHGKYLASTDTEVTWGWGSAAGKKRSLRRGKLLVEAGKIEQATKVLEIGCGTGLFTEFFANQKATIIAVDLSPDLLTKARSRYFLNNNVRFIEKPFEECSLEGPFDVIVCSSVLHHLNVDKSLIKILSLLKTDGRIAFAEPNMLNPQIWIQCHFRKFLKYMSADETAFIRWRLKRQLTKAGFAEIKIKPFDWLHPAIPSFLIGIASFIGLIFECIPIVREFSGSLLISAKKSRQ